MHDRLVAIQALFPIWQCDALMLEHPMDLFYLTGLRLSVGRLLITKKHAKLFVDGRYFAIASSTSPVEVAKLEDSIQNEYLEHADVHRLAFDSLTTSYDRYSRCERQFCQNGKKRVLVAISAPLKDLRLVKSEEECRKLRSSAALTKAALRHIIALLIPGITEKALAWEFEKFCRERGAQKMAFDPIIAFGPNTSFPHHRSSERAWHANEPALMDVGCVLDGYASDVTRTIWNEKIPPGYFRLHEIVVRSQKAALAICLPGTAFGDLDAAARQVMKEEGVEELFAHSLGHGIGLDVHEFPRLSIKADERNDVLKEGMVIIIEPGLYAPGICGVRHEDTIIVRKEGPENLYEDLEV